jgi:hypothetical protein
MYIWISYPAGVVIEGVIVSFARNRMRVVAPGMLDALELRRAGKKWFTESGEAVQIEFLADFSTTSEVRPAAACGAGSSAS